MDIVGEETGFETFARRAEPRLRRALSAGYGPELGGEATSDALVWAWRHWDRVQEMRNPHGYLYRVGRSALRRRTSRRETFPAPRPASEDHRFEPELLPALRRLTPNQRTCVLLIHGYEWTYEETATLLGISVSSTRNHVRRGLTRLRREMKGDRS